VELPHRYPFRLMDRVGPDRVRFELSGGSFWLRGDRSLPSAFCAEIVAQAAASLLAGPEESARERWLAGIDRLELRRPLRAGEQLEVRVRSEARFAGITKISGEIFAGDGKVAEATLLLA
jgi:3-hydroxymyristoyl/3-hydroxydecanoyl-(acyl carrier protein) dehydratase